MVLATTSLTGFSGETIWSLGQLRLLVTIRDADHDTKAWMNFMIVRSLSPYNGIIGRPGIRDIQAVPSTAHGMLKFPVDEGIVTIRSTILIPAECATVTTSSKEILKEAEVRHESFKSALHSNFPDQEAASDIDRVPPRSVLIIAQYRRKDIHLFGQKKGVRPRNRAKPSSRGTKTSREAGSCRIYYPPLGCPNPVMVKIYDGSYGGCAPLERFHGPKQGLSAGLLPLLEID
ncbi:hypothetical protein Tco_1081968 [Tanacetum coccineum]|uniref:Reverse transcriptase domain-containing protein n=1 Tax=Tanacetum coccineum TaxID=301880 RepID=A0ABQ5HZ55_9ASTR